MWLQYLLKSVTLNRLEDFQTLCEGLQRLRDKAQQLYDTTHIHNSPLSLKLMHTLC